MIIKYENDSNVMGKVCRELIGKHRQIPQTPELTVVIFFIEIDFKIYNRLENVLGTQIGASFRLNGVTSLCSKATNKVHLPSGLTSFMKTKQLQIIMKTIIDSQFSYCPLVWMFHSRKSYIFFSYIMMK